MVWKSDWLTEKSGQCLEQVWNAVLNRIISHYWQNSLQVIYTTAATPTHLLSQVAHPVSPKIGTFGSLPRSSGVGGWQTISNTRASSENSFLHTKTPALYTKTALYVVKSNHLGRLQVLHLPQHQVRRDLVTLHLLHIQTTNGHYSTITRNIHGFQGMIRDHFGDLWPFI